MTTLTLKINEHSKKGKAFLEFAKTFFDDKKDLEIIEQDAVEDDEEIVYSQAFIDKIDKAEANIKNGNTTRVNFDDLWGSIL